jgi:hypothetical protein
MKARMRAELKPHPDFPAPEGLTVEAQAVRSGRALLLRYRLTGRTELLLIPAASVPLRTESLWRHSCFEAFVQPAGGQGYVELNFSPSTRWAAYRFDGYRSGMADLEGVEPRVGCSVSPGGIELKAALELDAPGAWRIGLCAVVEATDGSLSYWALRHPPGKPDFHNRDCFALELAPAG